MSDIPPMRRPRRWLAVLLNLIIPGLGYLYAGRLQRALVFWLICGPVGMALLASPLLMAWPTLFALLQLIVVLVILVPVMLIDTWRISGAAASTTGRPAPMWSYALIVVATMGLSTAASSLMPPLSSQSYLVAASSMEPNLVIGDMFIATRAQRYLADISYGDIILFEREGTPWIKRVAALPGDTVAFRHGSLILNGVSLSSIFCGDVMTAKGPAKQFLETLPNGAKLVIQRLVPGNVLFDDVSLTVPPDSYFVLGDNRDYSADSRSFGVVPANQVIGRAALIYWSADWRRIGHNLAIR
jgi:signal peptidase I